MADAADADGEYRRLTVRQQALRMRSVAWSALHNFDVAPGRLRLLHHGTNTTFRLDTVDGDRLALRVNVNSIRQSAHLDAEAAWLRALAVDTDIRVPIPVPTSDGGSHTTVYSPSHRRDLAVVAMSWLPGRDLDDMTPIAARSVGRTMASMHRHAAQWALPDGCAFPVADGLLADQPDRLAADHPLLTDPVREIIGRVRDVVEGALDSVVRAQCSSAGWHPIHGDLHGGNMKWSRGRLAVFDFDDAVIGSPIQDLAVAVYYLRDDDTSETALWEGYAEIAEPLDPGPVEALVAGRNLVLVNEVLAGADSADRDIAAAYLHNTVVKLRAFLDSGRYRHDVPGLGPVSW